jgi:hypothetical protein
MFMKKLNKELFYEICYFFLKTGCFGGVPKRIMPQYGHSSLRPA